MFYGFDCLYDGECVLVNINWLIDCVYDVGILVFVVCYIGLVGFLIVFDVLFVVLLLVFVIDIVCDIVFDKIWLSCFVGMWFVEWLYVVGIGEIVIVGMKM